ncbi:unnamed protein product [Schistocephalus solidus]|uniref:Uncharacterized protein n=1 Tax=Schistocephalus solidus TaxID=70667 RepID=A0A183TFU4_SCHSO|nr:unnamed protein product [Schistocephalus solidus]
MVLSRGHGESCKGRKMKTFAFLCCRLSRNMIIYDEVAQRISKASQAFGRLQASMWNHHEPSTTIPTTTDNHFIDDPPPKITDTILSSHTLAPITTEHPQTQHLPKYLVLIVTAHARHASA